MHEGDERAEENSAQNMRMGSESGWQRQVRCRDDLARVLVVYEGLRRVRASGRATECVFFVTAEAVTHKATAAWGL